MHLLNIQHFSEFFHCDSIDVIEFTYKEWPMKHIKEKFKKTANLKPAESKKEQAGDIAYDKTAGIFYYELAEDPTTPLRENSLFASQPSPTKHNENPPRNLSIFSDELPDMQHGFSYKGDGAASRNMQKIIEPSLPAGFKKMTMWSPELKSFCIGVVPEDTPELTSEEYEKYAAIDLQ